MSSNRNHCSSVQPVLRSAFEGQLGRLMLVLFVCSSFMLAICRPHVNLRTSKVDMSGKIQTSCLQEWSTKPAEVGPQKVVARRSLPGHGRHAVFSSSITSFSLKGHASRCCGFHRFLSRGLGARVQHPLTASLAVSALMRRSCAAQVFEGHSCGRGLMSVGVVVALPGATTNWLCPQGCCWLAADAAAAATQTAAEWAAPTAFLSRGPSTASYQPHLRPTACEHANQASGRCKCSVHVHRRAFHGSNARIEASI